MERLEPFFPKSRSKPRLDDKRVLIGIIFVNRNGYFCEMRLPTTAGQKRCTTGGCAGVARVHSPAS